MIIALRFFADWCGPCMALTPTWNVIKDEFKDRVVFQDIDIDADPNTRQEHFVRAIPTIILLKDGKEISRRQSGGTLSDLRDWINEQRDL